MKVKFFLKFILIDIVLIGGYCGCSQTKRDNWAVEPLEIKYSEAREIEVWSSVLIGNEPALFYGTPLYD